MKLLTGKSERLGDSFQSVLEAIEVGVVGLGGTGSSVAEQLVRMGVRRLRLVDHDTFEPSNLSRLYGSKHKDVTKRRAKTDIVCSHLKGINRKAEIKSVKKSVLTNSVLKQLANCDIIFSCLDRHAPRAVLNELSNQCFIPVIDIGVGLDRQGESSGIGGTARATLIGPGLACLFCQEIIRPEIITAENLTPDQYESRRADGYVADMDDHPLSVIYYTTLASSLGLILFSEFLRGQKPGLTVLFDLESFDTIRLSPRESS